MENDNIQSNKIYNLINQANSILLVAHEKPDGDTLGSTAALSLFLDNIGKRYDIFCADPVPSYFFFLPNINKFKNQKAEIEKKEYDLIITIDCGDLKRTQLTSVIKNIKYSYKLINIDHHLSNPRFGDYNLIYPEYSSTAEIIFKLFVKWQVDINKEIATALLNGIFTDTGAFSTPSTTFNSLLIAGILINYGGRMQEINRYNFKNKSLTSLKLWGRALERLTVNKKYQLAHTVILKKDLEELKANEDDLEGLSTFFNNLTEVKASLLLKEDQGCIRGSFRTTDPRIDVNKLARIFGGGGHIKASGFTIKGKLNYNGKNWQIN